MSDTNVKKPKGAKAKAKLRKKLAKELELKPRVEFQDLCTTCFVAPECINRTTGMPVHYCEEYDEHPAVTPKPIIQPRPAVSNPMKVQGLCVNCEHRSDCTMACAPGGVWHCEEFC